MNAGPNRPRPVKQVVETDEDGFTKISGTGGSKLPGRSVTPKTIQTRGAPVPTKQTYAALEQDEKPSSTSKPLSQDMLNRRIKSMRSDFINDGGNVEEVLLSFDELTGTPDAGKTLVTKSADDSMECKDPERDAILRILSILVEKGKLKKEDVESGLVDVIEFIDSMVMDAPRAFEYLGNILGEMLRVKATSVAWVCEQLEKTKASDPGTKAPEEVIYFALSWLKTKGGPSALDESLRSSEVHVEKVLGADKWKTLSGRL